MSESPFYTPTGRPRRVSRGPLNASGPFRRTADIMAALLKTPPSPRWGQKHAEGVYAEAEERREVMSEKSKRIALILVGVVMALLAVAQHFGWIAGPPPLLAPGIQ
jgi:hypothetical protein